MASFKHLVALLALCAIMTVALGQITQGGPHINQGEAGSPQDGPHEHQRRSRRQAVDEVGQDEQDVVADLDEDDLAKDVEESATVSWTTCNFGVDPMVSCVDCNTRLICKRIGGLVVTCPNANKPYCNNGLCSPVPSVLCI